MSHIGWLLFVLVVGLGAERAMPEPPSVLRAIGLCMIVAAVIIAIFAYSTLVVVD